MGKPGSRKSSNRCSNSNSNTSIVSHKTTKENRIKRKRKIQNSIKKLFENLKNQSETEKTEERSVIIIDDVDSPIVTLKNKNNQFLDNSNEPKKLKRTLSVIEILDHEDNTPSKSSDLHLQTTPKRLKTSINCSTPIDNIVNRSPQLLNISNIKSNNNTEHTTNFNQEVAEVTKQINQDDYLTIDLTADTTVQSKTEDTAFNAENNTTVIDLEKEDEDACSLASNSMSDDSNVTVLNRKQHNERTEKRMQKFAEKISSLNATEKGKLLDMITKKIFSGCQSPKPIASQHSVKERATETMEDRYIKEVILNEAPSRNSIGSNIYNPEKDVRNKVGKRMIVIDGSNVAMEHSRGRIFSVKGLKICIDYWLRRGHNVKAFVPRFRCKYGKSSDPRQLDDLERQGLVIYTPSREIQGKMITSYDDRYIVQCAAEFDGVIVSGDQYRDLALENPRWRRVIETRLLPFTWVNDMIMFPRDPLGRNGPTLEQFLTHSNT